MGESRSKCGKWERRDGDKFRLFSLIFVRTFGEEDIRYEQYGDRWEYMAHGQTRCLGVRKLLLMRG